MRTSVTSALESPEKISLRRVSMEALRLYGQHFVPFTRPLILPTLQIVAGAYGCLCLSYWFINKMSARFGLALPEHLLELFGGLTVIIIVTMLIFKKGFLEYVLYVASLCTSARNALHGNPPNCRTDHQAFFKGKLIPYVILISTDVALLLLVSVPIVLMFLLAVIIHPDPVAASLLLGIGLLGSALIGILWVLSLFFLTFIFQIAGLDAHLPQNPLPVMLKSARLFLKAPFRTAALQILLFIATSAVIPWLIVLVVRPLHILAPLDAMHAWLIGTFIEHFAPGGSSANLPMAATFYTELQPRLGGTAASLSDSLLMAVLTSLLLPLGTFCFTLLYLKLESPLHQPEDRI